MDELRQTPIVEARGVGKRFGGVQALDDVSVAVAEGSVHALVGENGAGKSTLGKLFAGVLTPDGGEIVVDGEPVRLRSPRQALAAGVTAIAQELALVPMRSVIENVFLGMEDTRGGLIAARRLRRRYAELDAEVGFGIPGDVLVGTLRVADRQKVEVLRAIARRARVIVLDEPTAPLTGDEAERLLDTIRALRERGTAVVYVSHALAEVLAIADTISVLRDGRLVHTVPSAGQTQEDLVAAMLGRRMEVAFPPRRSVPDDAAVVLRARVSRPGVLRDVSLEVRAGEVLGLAGLVGSGRSEVARAIFGADPAERHVEVDGRTVHIRRPGDAVRCGIAMLPEDRKSQGLLMRRSVRENISVAHLGDLTRAGFVDSGRERTATDRLAGDLAIRMPSDGVPVEDLSGGNQQKVLFAKWLFRSPRVLIADEPTRGVDVGAKRSIYELIRGLAERGIAVLLISSEMEEVLGLAHRVLVMREGRVVEHVQDASTTTLEGVMHAAFGAGEAA